MKPGETKLFGTASSQQKGRRQGITCACSWTNGSLMCGFSKNGKTTDLGVSHVFRYPRNHAKIPYTPDHLWVIWSKSCEKNDWILNLLVLIKVQISATNNLVACSFMIGVVLFGDHQRWNSPLLQLQLQPEVDEKRHFSNIAAHSLALPSWAS